MAERLFRDGGRRSAPGSIGRQRPRRRRAPAGASKRSARSGSTPPTTCRARSTPVALAWADVAVSTCSEEACPVTPGVRRLTWHLADPKNMPLADVRVIRDEIQRLVGALVDELDAAADATPS